MARTRRIRGGFFGLFGPSKADKEKKDAEAVAAAAKQERSDAIIAKMRADAAARAVNQPQRSRQFGGKKKRRRGTKKGMRRKTARRAALATAALAGAIYMKRRKSRKHRKH